MHTEMLYEWFQAQGGSIDTSSIGITEFPLYGRGGVALRNIEDKLYSLSRESSPFLSGLRPYPTNSEKEHGSNLGWIAVGLDSFFA